MRRSFFFMLGLSLLLVGCGAAPSAPTNLQPRLALEPCRLKAPTSATISVVAQCGSLEVPENYDRPDGRTIKLRVAVVPAVSRNAMPDPLFLFAGGPGQAATEAFVPLLDSLSAVGQTRDLVLVDQRGTGGSSPLHCPTDALTAEETDSAALTRWAIACRANLDADPAFYTTAIAVSDIDAVRDALGYEQINLLGVSYGTRAVLSYLRQFPSRVRSIVLDGVAPQEMAIGADMDRDGQRAIDNMFARCADDPACAAAFPNVRDEFRALFDGLAIAPIDVALHDPFTGQPTNLRLTRDLAAITVQTMSYAPESVALLPLIIHTAQANGDLAPLAAQTIIINRQTSDSIDLGMRFSVLCAEDVPFYPAVAASTPSYLGDLLRRQLAAPCKAWPRGVVADDFKQPVQSAVPALLLSGENDPVTPPANGDAAARSLPNSRHIVAPGQGHNVFFRGCLPVLVADFIFTASPAELDVSCVERLGPTPFFTSFTGS